MNDNDPVSKLGLGTIMLVLSVVITFTVLPVSDAAIDDYALGPDGTAATGDEPATSVVSLAELIPLVIIAGLVIGSVYFLVDGARALKKS